MAANGAALLLLAVLLGVLLGYLLATSVAPSGVGIGNGTTVIVRERTLTIEKTVTETVTSTAWATRTETQTLTATKTLTLTETATRTVTATTTRTVTVVQAQLPGQAATAAAYYAEPQPPTEQRLQEQTIGPVTVALTPSYLVVEYRSRSPPGSYVVGVTSGYRVAASLAPPGAGGEDSVHAVYFRASPTGFAGYYPLQALAQKLGDGSYDVVVYGEGGVAWACSLILSHGVASLGDCRGTSYVDTSPSPRFTSYYQVAVSAVNATAIEAVAKAMGVLGVGDPAEAAWRILRWAHENMTYDLEKQRLLNNGTAVGIQPPLETLRLRRGICGDYAVLLSTAALGAGLDAYILVFDRANHAAAAVGLGGALYVLDQRLPPLELQDYLQYYNPVDEIVAVIHLHPGPGGATAVGYWLPRSSIPDTYPDDRAPPGLSEEAMTRLARRTGAEPNQALRSILGLGGGSYWRLSLPALSGIGVQPKHPLTRAYSPVFAQQWASWMADYMEGLLRRYYGDSVNGSFWASIEEDQNFTYVRLYAVPLRGFRVEVDMGAAALTVKVSPVADAVEDVSLLLYQRESSRPCAGVTPPGYRYTDIPYIVASSWRTVNGEAVIVVDLARLRDLASGNCGVGAWLGVWLRGSLVYGLRLN